MWFLINSLHWSLYKRIRLKLNANWSMDSTTNIYHRKYVSKNSFQVYQFLKLELHGNKMHSTDVLPIMFRWQTGPSYKILYFMENVWYEMFKECGDFL